MGKTERFTLPKKGLQKFLACPLGLCIFDLFSSKILISPEKMNFCIKTRKQAIFWIILRKVHAQTKKSINRSGAHLRNPARNPAQ